MNKEFELSKLPKHSHTYDFRILFIEWQMCEYATLAVKMTLAETAKPSPLVYSHNREGRVNETTDLESCPFCGRVPEQKILGNPCCGQHTVWCRNCQINGKWYSNQEEAINFWNTRVSDETHENTDYEKLECDAERYRWIKEKTEKARGHNDGWHLPAGRFFGKTIDEAIDHSMAKEKNNE